MKLVRIPLRISFVGGGSDLPAHYEKYGGAVVSTTIDKYIYITSKRSSSLFAHKYRLIYSQVEECNDVSEIKHPIIKQLVKQYEIDSLDLDIMSDVPSGTGLGSSSAFTVGLHHSFIEYPYPYSRADVAVLACETEITDLKEPIGKQDQFAAALGGLNLFRFTTHKVEVRHLSYKIGQRLNDYLTLVYLGGKRDAASILRSQSNDSSILRKMSLLAETLHYDLSEGNLDSLGPIVREGWELKKRLSPSISNDHIDAIIKIALDNGATGAKLLGAGGTGFVLLVCPPNLKGKMVKGLKPLNLNYVPFKLESEGCRVLYENQY